MFTELAPLAQRIERQIDATPIVDARSRLRADRPAAPDLVALLDEPGLRTERHAVGLRDDTPPREALPALARIRNTATGWCLGRILRDLYDLADPLLDESNLDAVADRVAATGRDPAWPSHLVREKCNIRAVATTGDVAPDGPSPTALGPTVELFGRLDLDSLLQPAPTIADALAGLFGGERIGTAELLERRLRDWLDRTVAGPCRFTSATRPLPDDADAAPEPRAADAALTRAAMGQPLADGEAALLARLAARTVLGWLDDHGKPIQVVARGIDAGALDRLARRYERARFVLVAADDAAVGAACDLARERPNVWHAGHGRHGFAPATIEPAVALRLQVAPARKLLAFLSDAPTVEWTYGRLQLVKKATASALARMIEARWLDEDTLPDLLRTIFHDAPREALDLR